MYETVRACGNCSLCCKLLAIPELEKPHGSWCQHCKPGAGRCTIYEQRPERCSTFRCLWLQGRLPDAARPDRIKALFTVSEHEYVVLLHVDYGRAWRGTEVDDIVNELLRKGIHVAVLPAGRPSMFLPAAGRSIPEAVRHKMVFGTMLGLEHPAPSRA